MESAMEKGAAPRDFFLLMVEEGMLIISAQLTRFCI